MFSPAEALRHNKQTLCLRKPRFTLVSKNVIFHFQLSKTVWPFFPYTASGHIMPIHSSPPDCVNVIVVSKAGFEDDAQISVGTACDCLPAFSMPQATVDI